MKKQIVKEPQPRNLLLVIVAKTVKGFVPNSEKMLKELHLPFKLDLTKTDVFKVGFDDLSKVKMDNLKAIIIHSKEKPTEIPTWFSVRNLDPLIHYTATAYGSMTELEKEEWKNFDPSKKLIPSNYAKA